MGRIEHQRVGSGESVEPGWSGGRRVRHRLVVALSIVWVGMVGCATVEESSLSVPLEPSTSARDEIDVAPVVLRWSTASERECYGYHVYRGPTVDGPFERLTADVIPGGGTTHEERSYRFEDRDALTVGTYFYFIEEVAMDGMTRRLTPPRPFEIEASD
ncbi:MAG: hypothetical protein AAGE94_16200 [Acidobacteriota bacterium]